MKIKAKYLVIGGVALLAYMSYRRARERLGSVIDAVNPASPDNLVYSGLSTVSGAINNAVDVPYQFTDDYLIARAVLISPFTSEESKRLARNRIEALKFTETLQP